VAAAVPLLQRLRKKGHEIHVAMPDQRPAREFVKPHNFHLRLAPSIRVATTVASPQVSYAEVLLCAGFYDANILYANVKKWLEMFHAVRPELIIFDHAPTALLAARLYPACTATFGPGFFRPPSVTPLPHFYADPHDLEGRMYRSEKRALLASNQVLQKGKGRRLHSLQALLDVDKDFLCTFRELDHYERSKEQRYMGPIFSADAGSEVTWPPGGRFKIFVYLKTDAPVSAEIVDALCRSDLACFVYAQGETSLDGDISTNVRVTRNPVALRSAIRDADMVVCHAGHGVVAATLLAGKPLVLVPLTTDQFIVTRNVENIGAGVGYAPGFRPESPFALVLATALEDTSLRKAALGFQAGHRDFDSDAQLNVIAKECDELVKAARVSTT